MTTVEEYVRQHIGQLVLQLAALQAENSRLRDELAKATAEVKGTE